MRSIVVASCTVTRVLALWLFLDSQRVKAEPKRIWETVLLLFYFFFVFCCIVVYLIGLHIPRIVNRNKTFSRRSLNKGCLRKSIARVKVIEEKTLMAHARGCLVITPCSSSSNKRVYNVFMFYSPSLLSGRSTDLSLVSIAINQRGETRVKHLWTSPPSNDRPLRPIQQKNRCCWTLSFWIFRTVDIFF